MTKTKRFAATREWSPSQVKARESTPAAKAEELKLIAAMIRADHFGRRITHFGSALQKPETGIAIDNLNLAFSAGHTLG